MAKQRLTVEVKLVVTYDLYGVTVAHIKELLEFNIRNSIGNGMLSGHTPASVDDWSMTIHSK